MIELSKLLEKASEGVLSQAGLTGLLLLCAIAFLYRELSKARKELEAEREDHDETRKALLDLTIKFLNTTNVYAEGMPLIKENLSNIKETLMQLAFVIRGANR